jgi:hypothetical protein
MAEILQGGRRDTISTAQFAVTNITEDYSLDCNANADLSTADVLGTLIRELIRKGIINGTVA